MNSPVPVPAAAPATRRKALAVVGTLVALGAIAAGAWWALVASRIEHTDNAYVQGHVVQITPQVNGTVIAIQADDTDVVKAGQALVRLDPADAQLALEQAEAQLGQAVREVRTMYANNATLAAQVALRDAEIDRAQADLARAHDDVARRTPLVASGAVGQEEFAHAKAQLAAAQSALAATRSAAAAARQALASNQVMTAGTAIEQHPGVQRAAGRVREAWLALKRTELKAPLDGVVARRSVQLGQRVAAGAPLMTVVALDQLWVDANFKESQLRKLRIGQPARLVADVYGEKVAFRGRIAGLGAGTGAAFALLPAQNATGNWIKVVQRVPVRIVLEPADLAAHPLRVGLSMAVEVDVSEGGGAALANTAPSAPAPATQRTTVFDALAGEAEAEVKRIVKANLGSAITVQ
ncbi:efflux RND transporter periplasmic adaptor subunit [Aquincola sp. S2]|uniref:Efflux RND transporter periplasmic adaptor subunit n=1 Tax=Pseudaquabacterium terrae TaxID=2732868 RepID=A0ABX2EIC0_9BURK|nr:efflux RND transporter periplasmic adaptor subunit [Aquabacterium terrae]NRF68376.1 efflux RND transporter periplasmic adaptor subunit [Aquabacterium terrae]